MEPSKIEFLLEKYFEAETSINDENVLKEYFSQPNIASHLLQYQPLFSYFKGSKEDILAVKTVLPRTKSYFGLLSIAASIMVFIGIGTFCYFNMKVVPDEDLGKFESPEVAFRETQKALSMLSTNVNVGIYGAERIHEFDKTTSIIFKN